MKSKKLPAAAEKDIVRLSSRPLFEKENFIWMIAGAVVMIIGFLLMSGGRSDDPNVFDKNQVYSATRITVAPIVILIGLVIEIFAIFRQPKKQVD
jgi:xanthine/uracil permease